MKNLAVIRDFSFADGPVPTISQTSILYMYLTKYSPLNFANAGSFTKFTKLRRTKVSTYTVLICGSVSLSVLYEICSLWKGLPYECSRLHPKRGLYPPPPHVKDNILTCIDAWLPSPCISPFIHTLPPQGISK